MSGPSLQVRQAREEASRRRLEVAKMLRDDPTVTNIELAKALKVSRNTITLDRKALMEELRSKALTETELMRAEMVARLEKLDGELELHRKGGKLPVGVLHEMHLVTRSMIELLGVRKPVTEKLEVRKNTISFTTTVVDTDRNGKHFDWVRTPEGWRQIEVPAPSREPQLVEVTQKQLVLKGATDEQR